MTRPSAPTRKTFSANLGWGLVSIPVAFYTATESNGVKRSEYTTDGHKVGRKPYDKETGEDVAHQDIIKKYEVEPDKVVALSDDEIEQVLQPKNGTAAILEFRPLMEWFDGRYVYNSMVQVRPDKVGTGKNKSQPGAKPFALLVECMKREKVFALVSLVTRGRTRFMALLPDGRAYLLHFDDEVREDLPMPEAEVTEAEVKMGLALIQSVRGKDDEDPVLLNDDAEKVHAYAVDKLGGKVSEPEATDEPAAPTDDLLAMLQASLQGVK